MSLSRKMGIVIVLVLSVWRIGEWVMTERRVWCDKCYISLTMRVQDEVVRGWKGWLVRYQTHDVICPYSQETKACNEFQKIEIGDKLRVWGQVNMNEYGKLQLVIKEVKSIKRQSGVSVWRGIRTIRAFRTRLDDGYKTTLSEPQSSLLSGITLGKNEKMPEHFYQALVDTGTIHVVAASGFNVTIVAKVILELCLRIMNRKKAVMVAIVGVGMYVLLAGSGPAVVRAGIMGSLVFIAQALGREYVAKGGLIISSILMVLISPWLLGDISFQLSVAATGGIVYGAEKVKRSLLLISRSRGNILNTICSDLGTTLAATGVTIPIILIHFGRLSIISPVVNVIITGFIPPLMALGAILAVAGLIWPPLAQLVAYVAWPLATLVILIVEWFGALPGASIDL